jgi:hypothetical protein
MLTRRQLLRLVGGLPFVSMPARQGWAKTSARVVVIGGGFGGAT